ncbi:phage holin family protein [Tahibacter harae]|uniref:Phage holin family protein n=1 Tax=Tahibacter harae TaxID=2963937 RepID=A0ABT1QS75_9GAMM|nr:phage holin family protein [Tahibacter harae]MCQ4165129.1 phage holin family protein [Tahibacter harae]
MSQHDQTLLGMIAVGVAVALSKLLVTAEPITWRALVGRSLVGGTTALISGVALALWTDLPPPAIYGLASLCAHVGAEGLMAYAGNYLNRKKDS